jgi:signal transduction histidine kinase
VTGGAGSRYTEARLTSMADRIWLVPPVAVILLVVVGAALSEQRPLVVAAATVVAVLGAVLLARDRLPVLPVAIVTTLAVAVICVGSSANLGWFAVCALAGTCSLHGARPGVVFAAVATAVFAVMWSLGPEWGWVTWVAGTFFTTVVCVMARRQHDLLQQLRAAQAGLADRARADERNRIARELHDVIGHSLTVSLLHVSSARLALQEDPDEAAAALEEAERLGRESLTEVRQAVGLLREGTGSSSAPMPGTDQLGALVDGLRRAGTPVSYEVVGDLSGLPATAGLTLYRILQEALTNVARHAPGVDVGVRIELADQQAVLTVDSAGPPGAGNVEGVGLHSMRERAAALGGVVVAGPEATGWRVRATLPVAARRVGAGR